MVFLWFSNPHRPSVASLIRGTTTAAVGRRACGHAATAGDSRTARGRA